MNHLVDPRPCDIYATSGTPCVAAHSTTRALYRQYSGALYQVSRESDGLMVDVPLLRVGGVANATVQDEFCDGTTCYMTIIYDQSGVRNHLTQAPAGGAGAGSTANGNDNLANAADAPVRLIRQKAYGVFISPGTGYRNDDTSLIATGDDPEGLYAIFDGTHYNEECCFDYGNAETSADDTGNGHMEAIYFGARSRSGGSGSGNGPWIMADLENGLFAGSKPIQNPDDPSLSSRFVTAFVKGEPDRWAVRGGDSTSGHLSTFFQGHRPNGGYNPLSKEGAIILGIGGDNSDAGQGTFYEGAMTRGYPSDHTENEIQANIMAANYVDLS